MPDYSTVSFPSREGGVTIAAWWVPATSAGAPAVVLVHGRGRCRGDPEVLLPAGMLHRHGFSVLVIDLRNHGGSTVTDGHHSFGVHEQADVLGAWDWLQSSQSVPAERIGLYGVSLGAASAIMALGTEARVAAVWEDSSFASVETGMPKELARNHLPEFLAPATVISSRRQLSRKRLVRRRYQSGSSTRCVHFGAPSGNRPYRFGYAWTLTASEASRLSPSPMSCAVAHA